MIIGAHILFYSKDPEADRAFFREALGFRSIDAGEGWLIFALPPTEAAIHPTDGTDFTQKHAGTALMGAVLYLMCDSLDSIIALLKAKKVECGPVQTAPWGRATTIPLPSGAAIGLYQPTHETALNLSSK
jgi:catechol 2,3-dioxygenase-like lactoylglutathione lyase family enzyme